MHDVKIDPRDWLLLILLSVLWGGSFFFIGVAVKELPAFTIVFVRVALAAAILLPVHWLWVGKLPHDWRPFIGMSILNNVVPFTLIVSGQALITSGLASVLNATAPLFGLVIMALAGDEKLLPRKVSGLVLGLIGVFVLRGDVGGEMLGILLVLGGAASYGLSSLWARRKMGGINPITSATCQMICSSFIMAALAAAIDQPWQLPAPSLSTWAALIALAALSTSLAYIVFFQILTRSGASNVLLVTLLIPVTAILLGWAFLGEPLDAHEILGAVIIASSLLIIDGRIVARFSAGAAPP